MNRSKNVRERKGVSPIDDLQADIKEAEILLKGLKKFSDEQIVVSLKERQSRADECSHLLAKTSLQMKLHQWIAGTVLNTQKKKLGYGAFGNWRRKNLEDPRIMSERTSQRLMKFAEQFSDPREMLEAQIASLTQANDEKISAETGLASPVKSKAEALLGSLTNLQKSLRHFSASGESFGADQLVQLKLVRDEVNQFVDKLTTNANATRSEEGGIDL